MPPSLPTEVTHILSAEPARKRPRLSDQDYGAILTKETKDLETSLEVDHMILDYLLSQAIATCFSNAHLHWTDAVSPVERDLQQVDAFQKLFRSRYPTYQLDAEIRFRQQLLQLVSLFSQRLTHNATTPGRTSLQRLRETNTARARRWIGDASRLPTAGRNTDPFDSDLPLSAQNLESNRAHVLSSLDLPPEDDAYDDAFYGTSASPSLLDLLPLFMRVSAACYSLFDSSVNDGWMALATEWMLQACMEQYLVFGASGSDALDEAFAWGHKEHGAEDEGPDELCEGMFEDEGAEVEGWAMRKTTALEKLFPQEGAVDGTMTLAKDGEAEARSREAAGETHLVSHLTSIAARHPVLEFEKSVLSFLEALSRSIPAPVLEQVERGQLDGMSEEQTQAFLKECGLGTVGLTCSPRLAR